VPRLAILFEFILIAALTAPLNLQSAEIMTYDQVVTDTFWNRLYVTGGWTLYCGYRFDATKRTEDGRVLTIEHIYPTRAMLKHLNCTSRQQCRESKNRRFIMMEADLHNMYPVWRTVNAVRNGSSYGIIDGENWRFDDCDFERQNGIAEPRAIARGNIARAIFYMHYQYGITIDKELLALLKEWNREDPPSAQEKQRNNYIEKIQGKRNPYIDHPELADKITISWLRPGKK